MKPIRRVWVLAALMCLGSAQAEDTQQSLGMKDSDEIGVTMSSYSYSEPSLSVTNNATNFGIAYEKTKSLQGNEFVLSEMEYVTGTDNYSGSGTASIPKYYFNLKLAYAKTFNISDYVLAPYIGIGYRFLDQNGAGVTSSTGAYAYDRQSTYIYLPVGVKRRDKLQNNAILETTAEFDYLLYGNQFSGLSIMNNHGYSNYPDINNSQKSGYGFYLSAMYKGNDGWSFGPYYKYWNIAQSDTVYATVTYGGSSYYGYAYEPANTTNEYGFKVMYKF
jgi:hypothetical protein